MRSSLYLLCLCGILSIVLKPSPLSAQGAKDKFYDATKKNSAETGAGPAWAVSVSSGALLYYGDMRAFNFWPATSPVNELNAGLGISVSHKLMPFLDVQANLLTGNISGQKRAAGANWAELNPQYLKGNIAEYSLTCKFNIMPLVSKSPQKFDVIAYAGIGMVQYRAITRYMFTDKLITASGYENATDLSNGTTSTASSALTFPLGLAFNYHITPQFSLGIDIGQRLTTTDKIDAWVGSTSQNDGYGYYALGLSYSFDCGMKCCKKK